MTGRKLRIFRRRAPGSPRRSAAGFASRLKAGVLRLRPGGATRMPWGKKATPPEGDPATKASIGSRMPWGKKATPPEGDPVTKASTGSRMPWGKKATPPAGEPATKASIGSRMPWSKKAARQPPPPTGDPGATAAVETTEVLDTAGTASFRDRGRLRRRLRYLRRARELAFRDVGGLIFDMRRFGRDRPDLVEAKLAALGAVDRELRALEQVLDDRRPIHELREPGLSSCPRCGALHASEDNFCPHCGLQFGGAQAMGEVGGAIAAPPQAPPAPIEQPTAATLVAPSPREEPAVPAGRDGEQPTEVYRPRDAS